MANGQWRVAYALNATNEAVKRHIYKPEHKFTFHRDRYVQGVFPLSSPHSRVDNNGLSWAENNCFNVHKRSATEKYIVHNARLALSCNPQKLREGEITFQSTTK